MPQGADEWAIIKQATYEFLKEFDDGGEDGPEEWKFVFELARAIYGGLFKNGIDPDHIRIIDYAHKVGKLCGDYYRDLVDLDLPKMWITVKIPAGYSPLTYAEERARLFPVRVNLHAKFSTESIAQDARKLVRVITTLKDINPGDAYLSTRDAGDILGKSHVYAGSLLRRLVESGDLVIVRGPTPKGATRYAPAS